MANQVSKCCGSKINQLTFFRLKRCEKCGNVCDGVSNYIYRKYYKRGKNG